MIELRPYQADIITRVGAAYGDGAESVVMQLATGGGKTAVASTLIARAVAKGRRVVFAAHLDALIDDTSERLAAAGVPHGIVQGGRPSEPQHPVQVCSLATLHRRGEAPPADFAIIDECHRAMSESVRGVIERYPTAKILGLTATPQRGDGKPLGNVFERLVCGPMPAELLALGHLVPCSVTAPLPTKPGTIAMDPVEAFERFGATSRAAIFFCANLEEVADILARLRVPAKPFTGEEPGKERRATLAAFRSGEVRALVNCTAALEGLDAPPIDLVISARAMGTTSAWLQACGRGLRPSRATGKTSCHVVDLTGAVFLHGLPDDARTWSIDGPPCRTGEALVALVRCKECLAVFHVASVCPRCGASTRGAGRKKRHSRVEQAEMRRVDDMPAEMRDAIALKGISNRLRQSGKFSEAQIPRIAQSILLKSRGKRA